VAGHLATKLAALLDRPDSLPGRKDRVEILALLSDPTTVSTPQILAEASARTPDERRALVAKTFEFLAADASLNRAGSSHNAWCTRLRSSHQP